MTTTGATAMATAGGSVIGRTTMTPQPPRLKCKPASRKALQRAKNNAATMSEALARAVHIVLNPFPPASESGSTVDAEMYFLPVA